MGIPESRITLADCVLAAEIFRERDIRASGKARHRAFELET